MDKACKSNATPLSFYSRYTVVVYYVYCIRSEKNGRVYTGFTENLKQRFKDHNSGKSSYTKNNRPYKLVYYEAYHSSDDARKREKSLKLRSNAYRQLRIRIKNSLE